MSGQDYTLKEIKLELTYRCLLKCIHCSSESCPTEALEMAYEDAERIVEQAVEMKVQKIAFSGGDPLLWPHLDKLVQTCSKAKLSVTLYSSGLSPNNRAVISNLRDSGLERIIFSLYAAASDVHDAITLTNQSHHLTIDAIKYSKSIGLITELHFVPMVPNYMELPAVAKLAGQLEIEQISVLRAVPQGRSQKQDGIVLSRQQTQELQGLVSKANKFANIRIGSPYSILWCDQSPNCMAGIDRLTIAPDLTISPCDAFKKIKSMDIVGSDMYSRLNERSLKECWQFSPYLNAVRTHIQDQHRGSCSQCGHFTQCRSGCAAQKYLKHGKLFSGPDPLCLGIPRKIAAD